MPFIILGLLAVSCNEDKFKSGGQPTLQPEDHLVSINGIDNYDAGYKTVASIDSLDFSIQETAFRSEAGQTSEIHAVDLYFVVDVTASMTDELGTIRTSLPSITENLRKKNVDLWSGFIGFVDGPSTAHTKILSDDIDELSNFIANISAKGNKDNEEGSIAAATFAANRFLQGDGRPDAVKIILLITDVVGHDGEGVDFNRNCRISPFVNKYNQLANQVGDSSKIKFFYTVPDPKNFKDPKIYGDSNVSQDDIMAHNECVDKETNETFKAKTQMERIFQSITPEYTAVQKGGPLLQANGELAWPLQGDVLTNTLVPMIETTIPTNRTLSCMAKKISVLNTSTKTSIFDWTKQNQNLVPVENNSIYLNDVIKNSRKAGEDMNIELHIDRCCMEVGADNKPVSQQCVTEYTQNVKYRIINK